MTNAEARFNNSLRPRKPEGSLGRTAQDGHESAMSMIPTLCTETSRTEHVVHLILESVFILGIFILNSSIPDSIFFKQIRTLFKIFVCKLLTEQPTLKTSHRSEKNCG